MASSLFDRGRAERFAHRLSAQEDSPGHTGTEHTGTEYARAAHTKVERTGTTRTESDRPHPTDRELEPLIELASRLSDLGTALDAEPRAEFRDRLKTRLLRAARAGENPFPEPLVTASVAPVSPAPVSPAPVPPATVSPAALATARPPTAPLVAGAPSGPGNRSRRRRAQAAVLVGVIAGTFTLSGVSFASNRAVPGDPLYPIKRTTERAQLALARSDLSRGELNLEFAQTRLNEAGSTGPSMVDLVLDDMDEETRIGVRLLTTMAVHRRSADLLDDVAAFAAAQRETLTRLLVGSPPSARLRLRSSIILLDAVAIRAEDLRASLPCELATTDDLGPVPTPCGDQQHTFR